AEKSGPKGLAAGRARPPGHLDQPRRRVRTQQRQEMARSRGVAEPPKRLQHWQIGFASPILLDTLPLTEPDLLCRRHLRHKGVDQGGLANARLASQENHLTLSLARLDPPLLELRQLPFSPD